MLRGAGRSGTVTSLKPFARTRRVCRPDEILLSASLPVASVVPLLISSNQMIALGSLVTVSAGVAGRGVRWAEVDAPSRRRLRAMTEEKKSGGKPTFRTPLKLRCSRITSLEILLLAKQHQRT